MTFQQHAKPSRQLDSVRTTGSVYRGDRDKSELPKLQNRAINYLSLFARDLAK